ncbi:MAG: biopolymer transporter ExbD [Treponema sp.]|nr:biopolymer transporter ExbD [Treponema sp.]
MFELKRKRRIARIATASMSDIGFLLLIFIMLISLINQRHEEKIEYSEAKVIEKTQVQKNLEIWVQKNGIISVDGKVLDSQELEGVITSRISEEPGVRIHIIADRNAPYKYVNEVVSVLQFLQHRTVSFVAKEEM